MAITLADLGKRIKCAPAHPVGTLSVNSHSASDGVKANIERRAISQRGEQGQRHISAANLVCFPPAATTVATTVANRDKTCAVNTSDRRDTKISIHTPLAELVRRHSQVLADVADVQDALDRDRTARRNLTAACAAEVARLEAARQPDYERAILKTKQLYAVRIAAKCCTPSQVRVYKTLLAEAKPKLELLEAVMRTQRELLAHDASIAQSIEAANNLGNANARKMSKRAKNDRKFRAWCERQNAPFEPATVEVASQAPSTDMYDVPRRVMHGATSVVVTSKVERAKRPAGHKALYGPDGLTDFRRAAEAFAVAKVGV